MPLMNDIGNNITKEEASDQVSCLNYLNLSTVSNNELLECAKRLKNLG